MQQRTYTISTSKVSPEMHTTSGRWAAPSGNDDMALRSLRKQLASRGDECLHLHEHIAVLESRLKDEDCRAIALQNAARRAAQASAELLEARREQTKLVAELAAARAALGRQEVGLKTL